MSRVFVVEDEAIVALELQDLLTDLGYEVCGIAGNADEALTEIPVANPDLILMDINLGTGPTGLDVAEQLSEQKDVPIVFCTAYSDQELTDRAARSGSFAYVVKPFLPQVLRANIEMALVRHRMDRELMAANCRLQETTTALRDSEARYRNLFDEAIEGIYRTARDGTILTVNPAFARIVGYDSPTELLGRRTTDFYVNADDRHRLQSGFAGQGSIEGVVLDWKQRSGRRITVELFGRELTDPDSGETIYQGFLRDITETAQQRKAMELLSSIPATMSGERFFDYLATGLAQILGVDYAYVTRLLPGGNQRIRYLSLHGVPPGQVVGECDIRGTACEQVVEHGSAQIDDHAQDHFPDDSRLAALQVNGFVGITLTDSNQRRIGTLGVMSRDPIGRPVHALDIVSMFSLRVAAEMERLRADRRYQVMTDAQSALMRKADREAILGRLLDGLVEVSDSMFGFAMELADGDNERLVTRASTFLTRAVPSRPRRTVRTIPSSRTRAEVDDDSDDPADRCGPAGFPVSRLVGVLDSVVTTAKPVIANHAQEGRAIAGVPLGCPPITALLVLPLICDGELVGLVAVANRTGGFDDSIISFLEPVTLTMANAVVAARNEIARRAAEDALRFEEERTRAILDSVPDAIITITASGEILGANPATELMFGYRVDEMIGKNVSMLMGEPERSRHDEYLSRYVERGIRTAIGSVRAVNARRRNGETFPAELSVAETTWHDETMFTGVVRDVSERVRALEREVGLRDELAAARFHQMIGSSRPMQKLYSAIEQIADGDWTVLIEGETGVGKELVARAIHAASPRSKGPFVTVNTAGLTESLVASQLFGHKRGAFTGADARQQGLFQAASGGTIFLDEIGDITMAVQKSLLRVIQEHEILPLGETVPRKVDVRIVAATHRNLVAEVHEGRFREDLLYRLRVARIRVPPLRERTDDIGALVDAFIATARATTGRPITGVSGAAMGLLREWSWPGNIRELKGAIDYAVIRCTGREIQPEDLPPELHSIESVAAPGPSSTAESVDRERILDALRRSGGNRTDAARLLGISRATLYRYLNKLSIK